MAIRERIVKGNEIIIHFAGASQKDYALCGQDLAGDSDYKQGTQTKNLVNCDDCIRIVKYCHGIPITEIQPKKRGKG